MFTIIILMNLLNYARVTPNKSMPLINIFYNQDRRVKLEVK